MGFCVVLNEVRSKLLKKLKFESKMYLHVGYLFKVNLPALYLTCFTQGQQKKYQISDSPFKPNWWRVQRVVNIKISCIVLSFVIEMEYWNQQFPSEISIFLIIDWYHKTLIWVLLAKCWVLLAKCFENLVLSCKIFYNHVYLSI